TIPQFGMVGFVLKNTLSEHGGVTRAICMIEDHKLLQIVEKRGIQAINGKVLWEGQEIDADSIISMNMWGMTPVMFTYLEKRFETFLSGVDPETLQGEFLVPTIIGTLLKEKQIEVEVLSSNDKWFGVTYREDIPSVKENIRHLIDEGKYPEKL
ncbi:MAG: nucleotidyltransferase, partial [Holdemanella sp.]|nr:nucleotidyltransferase [Holdemanella sp.]